MPSVQSVLAHAVRPRAYAVRRDAKAVSVVFIFMKDIVGEVRRGAAGQNAPNARPALRAGRNEVRAGDKKRRRDDKAYYAHDPSRSAHLKHLPISRSRRRFRRRPRFQAALRA